MTDIKDYISAYKYKIELHAHTRPCSDCGRLSPQELIDGLKREGFDAVVITNHYFYDHGAYRSTTSPMDTYLNAFRDCREYGEKMGIKVFLGAEYRFLESKNDYLVYGVDEKFLRDTFERSELTIESFYKEFHREDILIIEAHPFREDCGCSPVDPRFVDGYEIMNMQPGKLSKNVIAAKYARENGVSLVTIGADLHHARQLGLCSLRAKILPQNEKELVALLRSGDYIFDIGGYPMLPYAINA